MARLDDGSMTEWAHGATADLLFVRAVLAHAAHPELVVHERAAGHDAVGELCVAARADSAVVGDHGLAVCALVLTSTAVLRAVPGTKHTEQSEYLDTVEQGLSHLCIQRVIWTPRTLFFDSLDTQKCRSEFADDDNFRR